MRTFLLPNDGISLLGATIVTLLWLVAAGGVAIAGKRRAVPSARATGIGQHRCARRRTCRGDENPDLRIRLGASELLLGMVVGGLRLDRRGRRHLLVARRSPGGCVRVAPRWRRASLSAAVLVAAGLAVWPRYPVASVAADEVESHRVGRPLREQLVARSTPAPSTTTSKSIPSRAFFANDYPYVMLAELQRAGIEFHFVPESRNLERFGQSRCAEAGRFERLLLISALVPGLEPGSTIVAEVAGITDDELAEYAGLQDRFGDLLRDGTIVVDETALDDAAATTIEELRAVMTTPDRPASGLARHLDGWRRSGLATIPGVAAGRLRPLVRAGATLVGGLPDDCARTTECR